jgi:hypothetical protein
MENVATIKTLIENRKAHSLCSFFNGKTYYNGEEYGWNEFNETFPTNFSKVITDEQFKRMKGDNPDKTKIA